MDPFLEFQQNEAAEAERRERERQQRLDYGRRLIDAIYGGGTVAGRPVGSEAIYAPGTNYYDQSGAAWNPNTSSTERVIPGGTEQQITGYRTRTSSDDGGRVTRRPVFADVFVPSRTEVIGPEDPARQFEARRDEGELFLEPGQTYAGIGNDFYDAYRQSILDYYNPQVNNQFEDAKSQIQFDAARKGLLRSSAVAENQANLLTDVTDQRARVASDADAQTADLRRRFSGAQQNALSLLQATEDPTSASNAAVTELNAIRSQSPALSPLGDVFGTATRALQSYQDAQRNRRLLDQIPSSNPYGSSSGRNFA